MAGQTIPVKIGDVEVLVETADVSPAADAGLEPRVSAPVQKVEDAFSRAQDAIVAIASSTVQAVRNLAERAVRPDHLELAFGLSFSAQGDVIVAGASGQASLSVTLVYDTAPKIPAAAGATAPPAPPQSPSH